MLISVKPKDYSMVLDFVRSTPNETFFITENNQRFPIDNDRMLTKLLKASRYNLISIADNGDVEGIIVVWKSVFGESKRYYIKLVVANDKVAEKLLTGVIWNCPCDLFAKIRKTSNLISVFKQKGFSFLGGRGSEILLERKYVKVETHDNTRNRTNNQEHSRRYSHVR